MSYTPYNINCNSNNNYYYWFQFPYYINDVIAMLIIAISILSLDKKSLNEQKAYYITIMGMVGLSTHFSPKLPILELSILYAGEQDQSQKYPPQVGITQHW